MAQQQSVKPSNVLVVCKGNICRSPLAGAVLVKLIGQERVRDRGLDCKQGLLAAKKVRDYAAEQEIDLSQHRSLATTQADVDWADLILFMDNANLTRLLAFNPVAGKLKCLGDYVGATKIADPAWIKRGPELARLLGQIIVAAERVGKSLAAQKETPVG